MTPPSLSLSHPALEAQAAPFIFNELCVMKEDAGPCKAMKDHFFFDIDVGRCRLFEYGGCGGNDNNFQTIEACEQTCLVSGRFLLSVMLFCHLVCLSVR